MLKKKKTAFFLYPLLLIILAVISLFIFRSDFLRLLGSYLVDEDPIKPCPIAIILAGEFPDRALAAADIYSSGLAKKLVIPNERESAGLIELKRRDIKVKSYNATVRDLLLTLGVSPEDMLRLEDTTDRTSDEAEMLKRLIEKEEIEGCIIVVTSKYHTRRAGIIFRDIFKQAGNEIVIRTPRFEDYDPKEWWHDSRGIRATIIEYIKIISLPLY